jgi:predicted HTH transcriptional regulator
MRPFDRNRNLTKAERTRRIGQLIATAVIRYRHLHPEEFENCSRSSPSPRQEASVTFDSRDAVADEAEKQMLHYLSVVGTATPRDFQVTLGLSHATIARKLARLRTGNLVTVSGKTNAARYRLAPSEAMQPASMLKAA